MAGLTRGQVRAQPVKSDGELALEKLLQTYEARMGRLNDRYLEKMGEHIKEIGALHPSDVHRLQQIRRMNKNLRQLESRIGAAAGQSADEIEAVFEQIAREDARMAVKVLGMPDAAVSLENNEALRRILRAQARETAGRMANLSNTSVVSGYYRNAVDEACAAVQSGVEDYGSAIRRVIREAGAHGLRVREDGTRVVDYESGRSRRLDSAARMNVLDGVRHLNQSIMEEVGRQFGANGVEIDAHMLCAEDHLPYQGGQYSSEEFEQIQDSLERPFGEWNCRHSWHPIMLGISPATYTPEELERMRRFSTEPVTIDGQTKSRYEWSQVMRRCETRIRQVKDTANLARAAGDEPLRRQCQQRILALNGYYEQMSDQAGLGPAFERTYVAGFRDAKVKAAMARGDAIGQWPAGGEIISKAELEALKTYAGERGIRLRSFENFDGDVALIREFIDGMHRVAQDFPEVYTEFKGGLQLVNNFHMSPDDYANAGHHSSININAAAFRSRKALEEDYAERARTRWFVYGTTYHSIPYHEMGHVLRNVFKFSLRKAVGDVDLLHISTYAATDLEEGIAESVSAVYSEADNSEALTIWRRCSILIAERRG